MPVGNRHPPWLGLVVAVLVAAAGCSAGSTGQNVTVHVMPPTSKLTQPVSVRITGLTSHEVYTVTLSSTDAKGVRWASAARFKSRGDGTLDLDGAKSLDGSYHGVNGMGLMETLAPRHAPKAAAYWWSGAQRFNVAITSSAGKQLAHTGFQRRVGPGVHSTKQAVSKQGFDGVYYQKGDRAKKETRPAILAFGGSEGGNSMAFVGEGLAASGYPTLTIAYLHAPGLPKHLVKIPLEYFAKALRWLRNQPGVDRRRIYILGVSRGSEAAQLVALHYPKLVYGVILGVPSGVVQVGLTGGTGLSSKPAGASAWAVHGKPIPYAREVNEPHPTLVPSSVIPVEDITAPIFLVCGGSDEVWASCPFSHAIVDRLDNHHDRYRHELAAYPHAGHGVGSLVPYQPVAAKHEGRIAGRHPWSNQVARAKVWPRLMRFLHVTAQHPR